MDAPWTAQRKARRRSRSGLLFGDGSSPRCASESEYGDPPVEFARVSFASLFASQRRV